MLKSMILLHILFYIFCSTYFVPMSGDINLPIVNGHNLDYPSIEEAQKVTKDEILIIYRDLFRVSGIWQYPGIQ
jgi:hypothetical protein